MRLALQEPAPQAAPAHWAPPGAACSPPFWFLFQRRPYPLPSHQHSPNSWSDPGTASLSSPHPTPTNSLGPPEPLGNLSSKTRRCCCLWLKPPPPPKGDSTSSVTPATARRAPRSKGADSPPFPWLRSGPTGLGSTFASTVGPRRPRSPRPSECPDPVDPEAWGGQATGQEAAEARTPPRLSVNILTTY